MPHAGFDPTQLNAAEQKIVAATALGDWAFLLLRPDDPAAEPEGEKPTIRAGFLRHLLLRLPVPQGRGKTPKPWPVSPTGLRLLGAVIEGELDLTDASGVDSSCLPALALEHCDIPDPLRMDHAEISRLSLKGSRLYELSGHELSIKGQLELTYVKPMPLQGQPDQCWVHMDGSRIDGDVECHQALFIAPPKRDPRPTGERPNYALSLRDADICGRIEAHNIKATGGVSMGGAEIGGEVCFTSSTLEAGEEDAFDARYSRLKSYLLLNQFSPNGTPFSAKGGVRLLGAKINGNLECSGGKFHNLSGVAIMAQSIEIGGTCLLHNGFEAYGIVNFVDAKITGALQCDSGTFHNPDGDALRADNIEIGGPCSMRYGFMAVGGINLLSARITGNLSFTGGKCSNINGNGNAITAGNIYIGGDALFRNTSVEGTVYFHRAHIGNDLQVSLPGSTPVWDLSDAVIGTLRDNDGQGWGDAGTQLLADGLTYNRLEGCDSDTRLNWLRTYFDPNETRTYSPLPYTQLASALHATGHSEAARAVRRHQQWVELGWSMRQLLGIQAWQRIVAILGPETKLGKFLSAIGRPLKWIVERLVRYIETAMHALFGLFFAFGYSPARATVTFIAFLMIGTTAVDWANHHDLMVVDTTPVASAANDNQAVLPVMPFRTTGTLPCGHDIQSTLYALDVAIPLIDLHQEDKCEFGSTDEAYDKHWPAWLAWQWDVVAIWRWAKALYAMIGALITSLTLLTFTGILQRKDDAP